MSINLNVSLLCGNVTKDPEIKTVNKSKVAVARLALNKRFKKGEEWVEKTTYIDCEAWGDLAERVEASVKKGTKVFIRGRLESDEWTQKETGKTISKLKIYVLELQLVDKGKNAPATASVGGTDGNPNEGIDDLPF